METDGVIAEITSENFVECIGGNIEEIIKNNEKNHEKKMMRVDPKKREEARNIKMSELINIKTIGRDLLEKITYFLKKIILL